MLSLALVAFALRAYRLEFVLYDEETLEPFATWTLEEAVTVSEPSNQDAFSGPAESPERSS